MGKIEDPQHAKGEGKTRGDQKEEGRPGDSAHELTEKDVKRHNSKPLKFEIRISKSETNPNHQNSKSKAERLGFGHLLFEF